MLIHVPVERLHEDWPLIKEGLEKIIEKIKPDWIPEDVYHALRSNVSTVHLGYNGDEYEGFIVLTPTPDYDGVVLFIWCVYSPSRTNVLETYYEEVVQMARKIGAKKLRFASPRKGWSRMFEPVTTIYEREV